MKKLLFTFALLMITLAGYSQNFSIGPKFGLSSTKIDLEDGDFSTGDGEIGYHVGIFTRFGAAGFYLQPELLYTQTSGTFSYSSPTAGSSSEFKAQFNRLDIPVMLGFRMFKLLRIQAGPIGSINIKSELKDAADVVQDVDYKQATIGYQAGLGFDIGNFILDAKYESSLGNVTENVGGFQTDQRVSQWILSVGFKLF